MPSLPIAAPEAVVQEQTTAFTRARELANRGQLDEAEALCQQLQTRHQPDAELLCLLGVIQQARGDHSLAEAYYQKSLFLSPHHEESLTHLMLLHQLRGDAALAANYQRRLARTSKQDSKP